MKNLYSNSISDIPKMIFITQPDIEASRAEYQENNDEVEDKKSINDLNKEAEKRKEAQIPMKKAENKSNKQDEMYANILLGDLYENQETEEFPIPFKDKESYQKTKAEKDQQEAQNVLDSLQNINNFSTALDVENMTDEEIQNILTRREEIRQNYKPQGMPQSIEEAFTNNDKTFTRLEQFLTYGDIDLSAFEGLDFKGKWNINWNKALATALGKENLTKEEIKNIQIALGTKPDGYFGPHSANLLSEKRGEKGFQKEVEWNDKYLAKWEKYSKEYYKKNQTDSLAFLKMTEQLPDEINAKIANIEPNFDIDLAEFADIDNIDTDKEDIIENAADGTMAYVNNDVIPSLSPQLELTKKDGKWYHEFSDEPYNFTQDSIASFEKIKPEENMNTQVTEQKPLEEQADNQEELEKMINPMNGLNNVPEARMIADMTPEEIQEYNQLKAKREAIRNSYTPEITQEGDSDFIGPVRQENMNTQATEQAEVNEV